MKKTSNLLAGRVPVCDVKNKTKIPNTKQGKIRTRAQTSEPHSHEQNVKTRVKIIHGRTYETDVKNNRDKSSEGERRRY